MNCPLPSPRRRQFGRCAGRRFKGVDLLPSVIDITIFFVGHRERMRRKHHILKPLVRGILPANFTALLLLTLIGCNNNPYPAGETAQSIIYSAISDDPKTLDPSIGYDVASGVSSIIFILPICNTTILSVTRSWSRLSLGAEEPQRERVAVTITEDGKTTTTQGERWTFRIKKGLHFQDDPCFPGGKGREILAADFLLHLPTSGRPGGALPDYFSILTRR